MKFNFLKIFIISSAVFLGFGFLGAENAEACTIQNYKFRWVTPSGGFAESPGNPPLNGWYNDSNSPFVYIDFQSSGCVGQTREFSLTESDNNNVNANSDDDVNGPDANIDINPSSFLTSAWIDGVWCPSDEPFCLDNRPFVVPADNFTIVLQTGEDECESTSTPNCRYYVRINNQYYPTSATSVMQVPRLEYICDDLCFEDWSWIAVVPTDDGGELFVHPQDPVALSLTSSGGGSSTGITTGGITTYNINLQNPIGANTIVEFIEKAIKFAITVGIPIVAIAIIYSGLLFVTARGNDKQLETAKNAFTYAVIGGAVLLGSFIFANLIKETIESIALILNYYA